MWEIFVYTDGITLASLEVFVEFNNRWIKQSVTYLHFSSESLWPGALAPVFQPVSKSL